MLPKLFRAFVGRFDIEFLIAFLFLHPDVPKAAPAIAARPEPAFKKKSSVAVLAAFFIPSEMALSPGLSGVCGVASGFLLSVVPGTLLYILILLVFSLLLLIGCTSFCVLLYFFIFVIFYFIH